jgi:hypothetical protein
VCPARLCAVDCIESLVEEESDGPAEIDPGRTVGVEGRVVPEQSEEVDDHEAEATEGDLPHSLVSRAGGVLHCLPTALGLSRLAEKTIRSGSAYAMDMGKHLIATLV